MSLRAELLRLGLRAFFKERDHAQPDIHRIRRRLEKFKHLAPRPPAGTRADRILAAGVPCVRVTTPLSRPGHHILYLHGGAYIYGSPAHYRDFIWRIANAARATVLVPDYRLAPEHPFPAAVEDAVSTYRWLIAEGADPRRMAVMGDSAGGGLAFGTLLRLRDENSPLPASAVALSPWTNLGLDTPSAARNARTDPMLSTGQARVFADWYLAGADPKNPYASPLYGDHAGLPPSLIQVGSDELLRDDAEHMAARMRAAGCNVELEVWPRMPHVWHLFARILPEGRQATARAGKFVERNFAAH
jgi:monoterpene epsilon-lactone hydrolase